MIKLHNLFLFLRLTFKLSGPNDRPRNIFYPKLGIRANTRRMDLRSDFSALLGFREVLIVIVWAIEIELSLSDGLFFKY